MSYSILDWVEQWTGSKLGMEYVNPSPPMYPPWAPKNWCFWAVVLEKTLESPLGCKDIQPVHSEGDQSWVFFGRNDAKAKTPVLWPPHAKSWLIGKDSDAGRDWGQEEKGTTKDEMVGWHPLSSPSPPTFNLSQHQGLFQGVSSSDEVVKVLEF